MQIFLQILIAVLVAACAWWLVRKVLRFPTPSEPADEPFADVSARLKRGPKGRTGAVAVEEPDDFDYLDAYPPRRYNLLN